VALWVLVRQWRLMGFQGRKLLVGVGLSGMVIWAYSALFVLTMYARSLAHH